jgi:type II secretory pathway component PulJ
VDSGQWTGNGTRGRSHAHGFTLVELLISLTLTTMLSFVMGAMILAAHDGWEHSNGLSEANQQARTSQDRIKYMISQAGQYRLTGQSTTLGIAVVEQRYPLVNSPEILVVWSGGRAGGMVSAGVQSRLPRVNELVIYTLSSANPTRLMEIVHPTDASDLDFRAADFASRVRDVLTSALCQEILLCDRIRTSELFSLGPSPTVAGNVRFERCDSPTDAELQSVAPGSTAWFDLVWAQGIVSSGTGMRQTNIRMELQVESRSQPPGTGSATTTTAIPFFASASYRHVYQP